MFHQELCAIDCTNRGDAHYNKRNYPAAMIEYTEALTIDHGSVKALHGRGTIYFARGNYDAAITDYTQALTINPNMAITHNNRGLAHYLQKNINAAIADFNQAIAINPKDVNTHYNLGCAYHSNGQDEAEIRSYLIGLSIDPMSAMIQKNIANYKFPKRKIFEAITYLGNDIACELIKQALDEKTVLGEIFSQKSFIAKLSTNWKKELNDFYQTMNKQCAGKLVAPEILHGKLETKSSDTGPSASNRKTTAFKPFTTTQFATIFKLKPMIHANLNTAAEDMIQDSDSDEGVELKNMHIKLLNHC